MTMANTNEAPAPRGHNAIIIKALTRNGNGLTYAQLQERTGSARGYNAWQLKKVANRFGFKLKVIEADKTDDGWKRYRFEPKATKNVAMKAAANKVATERKVAKPKGKKKAAAKRA